MPTPRPRASRPTQAKTATRVLKAKRRDWRPAYLAALRECGQYTKAAKAAGKDHSTVWDERQKNAAFAQAEDDAMQVAARLLEQEAVRRAVDGVRRLKFGKDGEPLIDPHTQEPYVEHEYSDTLLLRLLAGRMPEKYGNKTEIKGDLNAAIELIVTPDMLSQIQQERAAALAGGKN